MDISLSYPFFMLFFMYVVFGDLTLGFHAAYGIFFLVALKSFFYDIWLICKKYIFKNNVDIPKDGRVRKIILYFFMFGALICILINFFPVFQHKNELHHMLKVYHTLPAELVEQSINDLKSDPEGMKQCSFFLMPSLRDNKSEVIAKYLAYFAYEEKYCKTWWQWGQNDCGYLEEMQTKDDDATELSKVVELCKLAKRHPSSQK